MTTTTPDDLEERMLAEAEAEAQRRAVEGNADDAEADDDEPADDQRVVVAQPVAPPAPREPLPFEHQNADHVWRLAVQIAKSNIVPEAYRGNPANVFLVCMTGREHGLSPMQSLAAMHVVDGKVGMSAQMIVALVLQSGLADYFRLKKSDDFTATYVTRRKGWGAECYDCGRSFPSELAGQHCGCQSAEDAGPAIALVQRTLTFTIDDAKRMDLTRKKNWQRMPAIMLRWRAASQLARDVYPDVTLGIYSDDELHDAVDVGPPVEVPPERGTAGLKAAIAGD